METDLLAGRTCLVTGATSGIGRAAALGLARLGAHLLLVGRDPERGRETLEEIGRVQGPGRAELLLADLSSKAEIEDLATRVLSCAPALHVLVNNAAVFRTRRELTRDGVEATFAVNHLAYFQLTGLLLPRLRQSAPARIVNVASDAHRFGELDLDDLQSERSYRAMRVYGRSKSANIVFTYELARRLSETDVTVNCLHPGAIASRLGRDNGTLLGLVQRVLTAFLKSPTRGAETVIHLASAPELAGVSGRYFVDCRERPSADHTHDEASARRLFEISQELTGVRFP